MSGGGPFSTFRQQRGTGPANLWGGQSYTPYMQQPRGQMMQPGFVGGGGYMGGGGYQAWPGFGMGGMPSRFGGLTGYQSFGQPGMMFGGFSGGYNPYGPGSFSSPGSMPYGGGSGMFGGGGYNTMVNRMAAIPYQQMMGSRFSMPYRYINTEQQAAQQQAAQQQQRVQNLRQNNPMNPASGCYYDSSQDDYICPS